MRRSTKTISYLLVLIIFILLAHRPIAIGLMSLVDSIGALFNINVVNIIDFLNTIYYL